MQFMPFEILGILDDIEQHIKLAVQFTADLDYAAFCDDTRTVYAVTRCLEIISEASRRLPDDLKTRHPAIPWKDIAGAGNVYRHDYEDVAARIIWDTVLLALPPLRNAIVDEIERIVSSEGDESPGKA
jgi:uncharacterized protein with HEPN domain